MKGSAWASISAARRNCSSGDGTIVAGRQQRRGGDQDRQAGEQRGRDGLGKQELAEHQEIAEQGR
jgi:hypothetical protein